MPSPEAQNAFKQRQAARAAAKAAVLEKLGKSVSKTAVATTPSEATIPSEPLAASVPLAQPTELLDPVSNARQQAIDFIVGRKPGVVGVAASSQPAKSSAPYPKMAMPLRIPSGGTQGRYHLTRAALRMRQPESKSEEKK